MNRIITLVLATIVLIISILGIFNVLDISKTIPLALGFLGFLNINNGVVLYKENKKKNAYFVWLSGILIIVVAFYTGFVR